MSLRSLYKRSSGHVAFTVDPVRDLLIWAIIQNRRELAEIIWAQVPRPASWHAWLWGDQGQGSSWGSWPESQPQGVGPQHRAMQGGQWVSTTAEGAQGVQGWRTESLALGPRQEENF